jgi:hypothetical protein
MAVKPVRIVDLFSAEAAARVLAGDWVCLLPLLPGDGYWRGGEFRPVTAETLAAMATIYKDRKNLGLPARLAVKAEHEPELGAFGWITDVQARADGVYIKVDPTSRGRGLLEDDAFAYLSAEVWWEYELPATGQVIGPVLSGAAFTNDPFFGEATAMYSRRAAERFMTEGGDVDEAEQKKAWARSMLLDFIGGMLGLVRDLGWKAQDLRWLAEDGAVSLEADLEEPRKALVLALAEAAGELPGLYAMLGGKDTMSVQPAAGPATDRGKPGEGAPHKHSSGGKTLEDVELKPEELRGLQRFLADPVAFLFGRGGKESGGGPAAEDFAGQMQALRAEFAQQMEAARAEFAAVQTERDALAGRVQGLESQLTGAEEARLAERFSRRAEKFKALGAKAEELAGHLQWLYQADKGGEHFAYFDALLAANDGALAQSAAFSEAGIGGPARVGSAREQFAAQVKAAQAEGLDYAAAMAKVSRENPDLYSQAVRPQPGE